MYTCSPSRANMARTKVVRMITFTSFFTEYTIALTMVFRPGMTATDFRALKTLNVLKAENAPKSIAMVTYDIPITEKSSQFQGSRRYVKVAKANPLEISLMADSYV